MPGWDSLQTVTAAHGTLQLAGLILLVIAATLAGFVAYQLRDGVWPEWLDVGAYQLRSRFFAIGSAAVLALLFVAEIAAYGYGVRQGSLMAAAEQAGADRIKRLAAETKPRPTADSSSRSHAFHNTKGLYFHGYLPLGLFPTILRPLLPCHAHGKIAFFWRFQEHWC